MRSERTALIRRRSRHEPTSVAAARRAGHGRVRAGDDQRSRRIGRGQFILLLSEPVLAEIREVPLRPELTRRYSHLTGERVALS